MYDVVREAFTVPKTLRRAILFTLPQLSGANVIASYIIPILKMISTSDNAARNMFLSSMYSLAKLFVTLIASFLLIDRLGRHKTLFIGITF